MEIKEGQKAIAKQGGHKFEVGSLITFIDKEHWMGHTLYIFEGMTYGVETNQWLFKGEFEVLNLVVKD
jgi:hypothetical protein